MKIQTKVSKNVFKDNILNDDIVDFMDRNGITNFWYEKTELLDIDEEEIINSYLHACPNSICGPGYWYTNKVYDQVHNLTHFIGGDKEDMTYEIVEPGYPYDIPWADTVFETVDEFRAWMLKEGKNNI